MTTLAAILALCAASRRIDLPWRSRRALDALLAAVLLQVALGISTLLLVVPIPLAVAHQAGALLLFTAALVAHHALREAAAPATLPMAQLDESRPALL
jgi:cytochrome c oxidase assembly protein subunit 15